MHNNFEHFIITAFNVDFGLKSREQILSLEYLIQRFQLFKQFCYPSVFHQNNQNFKWLVFFDSEIPSIFKNEINTWAKDWDKFVPVYVTPVSKPGDFWRDIVKEYMSPSTEYLITTNLDNDDSISKDFVDLVQRNFQQQDFEFLNFAYGYMLREDGLFLREFLASPFISLIEKTDNILTCKTICHNDLFQLYEQGVNVRQILTKPAWLQVVHGTNLKNRLDVNSVIQPIDKLKKRFGIQIDEQKYQQSLYINQCLDFAYRFLFINKYQLPLGLRIRRLVSMTIPAFAPVYLKYSLASKERSSPRPQLSIDAARSLCEQWTSEYENLKIV